LLRSFWNLQNEPLGMETDHVLTSSIVLGQQRYRDVSQRLSFFEELERRLQRVPGVDAVAISDTLPPSGRTQAMIFSRIQVEGHERPAEGTGGMVVWRSVTPEYFAALEIPIVKGRSFIEEDRDPQQRVIMLSEALAARLFPNEDPLQKQLRFGPEGAWHTVIGVAADVKNAGLSGPSDAEYYLVRQHAPAPSNQEALARDPGRRAAVVLRTDAHPTMVAEWLKAEIGGLDPTLPVSIETMNQKVSQLAERPRFNAVLLGLFAALGMLLAAVGLYGVMAFLVTERTREIGVRMALGATPRDIARLVLSHAARWTIGGTMLGVAAAAAATGLLKSMLFGVAERDPATLAGAALLLLIVALVAAWIPSRRAALVDPMRALRME
jgi:predicted permease